MLVVKKRKKGGKEESDEALISRFRKRSADIISEVRERQAYKKDSEKRAEKKKRIKFNIELEKKRGN